MSAVRWGHWGSPGYPILAFDLSTAFWPTLICILQLQPLLLFAGQLGSARTWTAAAGLARTGTATNPVCSQWLSALQLIISSNLRASLDSALPAK